MSAECNLSEREGDMMKWFTLNNAHSSRARKREREGGGGEGREREKRNFNDDSNLTMQSAPIPFIILSSETGNIIHFLYNIRKAFVVLRIWLPAGTFGKYSFHVHVQCTTPEIGTRS